MTSNNNAVLYGNQVIALAKRNLSVMSSSVVAVKAVKKATKPIISDWAAILVNAGFNVVEGKKRISAAAKNHVSIIRGMKAALLRIKSIVDMKRELRGLSLGIKKAKTMLNAMAMSWFDYCDASAKLRAMQARASYIVAIVF
jgi:hypothetical protein